jgi:ribonuclease HI
MSKGQPPQSHELIAYIDGASRGNPGRAAYGVVVETSDGKRLAELKDVLGLTTNNVAEYRALLAALDYALSHKHGCLRVMSDSELLTRQLTGSYKVRSAALKPLHEQARKMIARLEAFSIQHVPRAQNRDADRLANQALDAEACGEVSKPLLPSAPGEPLRASATYQRGLLKPHCELPFAEGEEVEMQIRRKK